MIHPVLKPIKIKKERKIRRIKKTPEARIISQIDSCDTYIALITHRFVCFHCGGRASMNHHFFHKASHGEVRFDPRNHCPVCYGCHEYRIHRAGETEPTRDKIIAYWGLCEFNSLKMKAAGEADRSMPYLKKELEYKEGLLIELVNNTSYSVLEMLSNHAEQKISVIKKRVKQRLIALGGNNDKSTV